MGSLRTRVILTLLFCAPVVHAAAPAPKPAFSLPWGLRPAVAPNVVRFESTFAIQNDALAVPLLLLAAYKIVPDVAVLVRVSIVGTTAKSSNTPGGVAFVNPVVGVLYTPELAPGLRLPIFAGCNIPIGMGAESDAPKSEAAAAAAGINARSGLDNALYGVRFATLSAGLGLAYASKPVTIHAEATVAQLLRDRGAALERDTERTNITMGLHFGYAVHEKLTLSSEIRLQAWASTPGFVRTDPSRREQGTFGFGARTSIPLSKTVTMRPGISYFQAFDAPMAAAGYRIITLDLPIAF